MWPQADCAVAALKHQQCTQSNYQRQNYQEQRHYLSEEEEELYEKHKSESKFLSTNKLFYNKIKAIIKKRMTNESNTKMRRTRCQHQNYLNCATDDDEVSAHKSVTKHSGSTSFSRSGSEVSRITAAAAASIAASAKQKKAHSHKCNYNIRTSNNNNLSVLLQIATLCLFLLLTMKINHIEATPVQDFVAGGSGSAAAAITNKAITQNTSQQQQQQQRQLFAMLTKNSKNYNGINNNAELMQTAAKEEIEHPYNSKHDNAQQSSHQMESSNIEIPRPSIVAASLETTGYVADDGMQYEKAEKVLTAAAAAAQSGEKSIYNNNNCPKECKCLNVYFDCGKLHLTRVPDFPNYVQILDLVANRLNDSAVLEIKNLPELQKLTLKRNQLDVLPKFVGLLALKQLNLANNRIQLISSEALAALPKLKSLDLSKNFLHTIEANWFPRVNRLTHLILNANEIASIDEHAFEFLIELNDLELNNNRLLSLPGGAFKTLSKLKKLSLNNNYLEINWSTFRGLLAVQKLFLKSNNIRALQDGVFHVMRNIEVIELDHNGITSLSRQGLFNLTKLHHLSLSNNTISRIELDTWEFTQTLEYLDLSYNNITEFKPQHLDCLQRLKHLNLGHNKIQYVMENTFDCVKNLEDLNLRRNRLSWVIEDPNAAPPFKSLRKLRKLDLYGNNLKQINSKSLSGLNNLELLNLGGNALATIQAGAFEHMVRLQKLIFKSLNFICNCELVWFQRFLQSRFNANTQQVHTNAVCGYPEHLLDRKLLQLTTAELECADSPKPVLTQEPSNILAVKGANITMECTAKSPAAASLAAADELKIKWRHDNQNIRERPSATSNTETQIHHDQSLNQTTIYGYLRLFNVTYESSGRYQCVVSNAFGTTYSQKFKMSIGIHPAFLQKPSNLTIDAGETARLVCSATGDPMPEIALQKFGASDFPAATERRLQVIREENAFLITNAKPTDSGIYTCTAESAAGEIKVNATLIVNDKPQPALPRVRKEVVLGRTCVLECLNEEATASLAQMNREWFKDNKPIHISPTSHSERFYFTTDKELLIIIKTQSNDAGNYRCEITDNIKTLTLQSELIVIKEVYNNDVIMMGVAMVTIACVLVGSCIIWSILCYQKRKLKLSSAGQRTSMARIAAAASHNLLSGSRGSAMDQTQMTTLNRTYLRQQQVHQHLQEHNERLRPRSLADLDLQHDYGVPHSRLVVTTTPNFNGTACLGEEGLTLSYLQHNNDLEQQQDHLSSKDSGTGSDAAVKRSIEDFSIALLPNTASTPTPTPPTAAKALLKQNGNEVDADDDEDDDDYDDDNDNDLQFASTRALGVSAYDYMELPELNSNSNMSPINGIHVAKSTNSIIEASRPLAAAPLPPLRQCGAQVSTKFGLNTTKPNDIDI